MDRDEVEAGDGDDKGETDEDEDGATGGRNG